MTDLMRWHTHGDNHPTHAPPLRCCSDAATALLWQVERRAAQDLGEERARFVTAAVAGIAEYARAAGSVLDPRLQGLVETVARNCVDAVRRAACTCPVVDVRDVGEARPGAVRSLDRSCGVHGTAATT